MSDRDRRRHEDRLRRQRRTRLERLGLGAILVAVVAIGAFLLLRGGSGDEPEAAAPAAEATSRGATTTETERAAAPESRVEIAATGDIAVLGEPPGGGAALVASVDGLLEGDVVVGNLEGTLATGGVSKCGEDEAAADEPQTCFAFRAPPELAGHLRTAGFTVMNLANNHSSDFGPGGLEETLAALDAAGLLATGTPERIATQTVAGGADGQPVKVAVLGFAPYPETNSLLDIPGAQALVERADAQADLVVVTFHGGAEGPDALHVQPGEETYLGERRGDAVAFSHAVVDAGADLVLGHGPHVVRGMEFHQGRLLAYSLGNFATYKGLNVDGVRGLSAVLQVTLAGDGGFVAGRLRPVFIPASGAPQPGGAAVEHVRVLSRQDFGDSAPRIDGAGRIRPPAAPQDSG